MNVLAVVPHGDDEALGLSGVIFKHFKQGGNVTVCIVTQPWEPEWTKTYIKNRQKEIRKASFILGYGYHNKGLKAGALDEIPEIKLNALLKIEIIGSDIVFIPYHNDLSKDHRIVHNSCMQVLKNLFEPTILEYEVISETPSSFQPNYYIILSDEMLKAKLDAVKAYRTELKTYPNPRSLKAIKALTMKRGSEVGVKYAEAFKLIRKVI